MVFHEKADHHIERLSFTGDLALNIFMVNSGIIMFKASLSRKSKLRVAAAIALLALGACASVETSNPNQAELDQEAVFQRQLVVEQNVATQRRIENVTFRLMTAAADFC